MASVFIIIVLGLLIFPEFLLLSIISNEPAQNGSAFRVVRYQSDHLCECDLFYLVRIHYVKQVGNNVVALLA
jgi:hypothetical protein